MGLLSGGDLPCSPTSLCVIEEMRLQTAQELAQDHKVIGLFPACALMNTLDWLLLRWRKRETLD